MNFSNHPVFTEIKTMLCSLLMEEGLVWHEKKQWIKSIDAFSRAKEISRNLYTKSLKKKIKTIIANDTYDNFYGESYERSLIHFYLVLNYYLLSQRQKDTSSHYLLKARAEILDWDSWQTSIREERLGKTVFKYDLLAKVFGGMVHENIGGTQEMAIALQLYKDAKEILFRNYNCYEDFNDNFRKFKADYSRLPSMNKKQVQEKYVSATERQMELIRFLNGKIENIKQKKKHNISLIFQNGLIPPKKPEKYYYSLVSAMKGNKSSIIQKIGVAVLTLFALEKLRLVPPPENWTLGKFYWGATLSQITMNEAAISFELPKVEKIGKAKKMVLHIFKKGKKILETPLILINPMGDMAREAISEKNFWLYGRTGIRVALKHITAIVSSFLTYKAMSKDKKNNFLARSIAVSQYLIASKAIAKSERADIRYWSSLPKEFRMVSLYLPKGEYDLKILFGEKYKDVGFVSIDGKKKKYFINYRTI